MTAEQIAQPLMSVIEAAAEHNDLVLWIVREQLTELHRLACLSTDPATRAFADRWTDELEAIRGTFDA